MNKDCIFCDHESIKEDILWESDNFFIKVGKGILTPGHVLLISKKHLSCFGEMPENLYDEFNGVKERIFNEVKDKFSEPILFEQGVHGQSINHAHIHILPTKNKNFILPSNINNKIFLELKKTEIENIKDIKKVFQKEGNYLYLEEKGISYIYHLDKNDSKKRAFRIVLTDINGEKEFTHWENMSKLSEIKNQKWVELTKNNLKIN